MEPMLKKNKQSQSKPVATMFTNVEDEMQCIKIISVLDEFINNNNNDDNNDYPYVINFILKEIGEYSTGNKVKCKGELNKNECDGWIHFLSGDNFGDNNKIYGYNNDLPFAKNLSFAYGLFKYECDDGKCQRVSHILKCKDEQCNLIIQCDEEDKIPINEIFLCQNSLGLRCKCRECYCKNHWMKNGVKCESCSLFYCKSCSKNEGDYCINCQKYVCNNHENLGSMPGECDPESVYVMCVSCFYLQSEPNSFEEEIRMIIHSD